MNRTARLESLIAELTEAGLLADRNRVELLVLKGIRSFRDEFPDLCQLLAETLAQNSANGAALRWKNVGPPPSDGDEGLALLRVEESIDHPKPELPSQIVSQVTSFLSQRKASERLIAEGFSPPGLLLLKGEPGTGKTMLAGWLADELGLPMIVQDLATSVSSYLGKTGHNLKRSLDYARSTPCLLLLDEFDAIAKRRDDSTDVGELNRIVNVLLKELERWPLHSVLVAATNHALLLDPAINRRFHLILELPLPGFEQRCCIITAASGRFKDEFSPSFLEALAKVTEGLSGSDLNSLVQSAVRRHIVSGESVYRTAIDELRCFNSAKFDDRPLGPLIRATRNAAAKKCTVRDLADMFGKSASTIQYHLKRDTEHA